MFNDNFNALARSQVDLSPRDLRDRIDAFNESIYQSVNNGVYKCGFAQSQQAYDEAVGPLFSRLDELEGMFASQRYCLAGHLYPTECDVRLFVTIVRFDEVYVVHFKCDKRCIREYCNLSAWMRDVYQTLDLGPTVNMMHIKHHYYGSHHGINKYGIVPLGPGTMLSLAAPHHRNGMTN
jgi:putative glutathione S-transferase